MRIEETLLTAGKIRDQLKREKDYPENPIDISVSCVKPFKGGSEIKLIIIGQDPTIRNKDRRSSISTTLNLDKTNGSLYKYVNDICQFCEMTIENVYATNIFKYFYSQPPATTLSILREHFSENLDLLKSELLEFPNVPIITLGEPVLQLLSGQDSFVNKFWNYDKRTSQSNGEFRYCQFNAINRNIYPYPHQPSSIKNFYKKYIKDYSQYLLRSHKANYRK